MPEMNGYEIAAHIQALESGAWNRMIPIVALTAHAINGDREKRLAAGMNDYIAKPGRAFGIGGGSGEMVAAQRREFSWVGAVTDS